jgi:hypothetical protein
MPVASLDIYADITEGLFLLQLLHESQDEMNDRMRNTTKDQDPRDQLLPLPRPVGIGCSGPI